MNKLISKENKFGFVALAVLLIIFALVSRLLPHPPNFAPIAAVAIFGAFYLPRRLALVLPLTALFISDVFIGFYSLPLMIAVYGSFALVGFIALMMRKEKSAGTIFGITLLGSILFFLITNAAVWAFGSMYAPGVPGLMQSYAMAVPFFRNTLLGDLFYVGAFVSIAEFAMNFDRFRSYFAMNTLTKRQI